MSVGRGEQIERRMQHLIAPSDFWKRVRRQSCKQIKKWKNRRERRAANINPEVLPEYRKYKGWEY
jgi:hypothetical protein